MQGPTKQQRIERFRENLDSVCIDIYGDNEEAMIQANKVFAQMEEDDFWGLLDEEK